MEIKDKKDFKDFLSFKRMITPVIIQILFWIGLAASILMAIMMIIKGGASALIGLAFLILGPIMVRVYCEILILFFRMNETLTEIACNTCCKEEQGEPCCQKKE